MKFPLILAVFALCINSALSQASIPKPRATPNIVVKENQLLLVLNSVNLTFKVNAPEARDKSFLASYVSANATVSMLRKDVTTADLSFLAPANKSEGLDITKFDLKMVFKQANATGGYWALNGSALTLEGDVKVGTLNQAIKYTDENLLSDIQLYAPDKMSFHCSRFGPLFPVGGSPNYSVSIDLKGFQVEPFKNDTESFNPAFECVGFFSIGILTGIFITIILLAVLTWGMSMILDVKTMDRFDDPKGKPMLFGGNE